LTALSTFSLGTATVIFLSKPCVVSTETCMYKPHHFQAKTRNL
jgi:hypothetical protein